MIAIRIISGVVDHFAVRLAEWLCTLILLFFGLTLLRAGNSFENPSFVVLAAYADEDAWGCIIFAIAALRLLALILNGTFSWSARISLIVRSACATLCIGVWFALSVGIYLAGSSAPDSRTYAMLMLADVFLAAYTAGRTGAQFRAAAHGRS